MCVIAFLSILVHVLYNGQFITFYNICSCLVISGATAVTPWCMRLLNLSGPNIVLCSGTLRIMRFHLLSFFK